MEIQEKRRYGTIADFNLKSSNYWDKRFVFVLKHQNLHPSVEGRSFPNSVYLKLKDKIFDKNKNKVRDIQVVPGEMSIYMDEQTDEGKKANPISKEFSKDGDLIVEAREDQTLEFLMRCNFNETNPDRDKSKKAWFGLLDLKQGMDSEMKKDEQEAEAANWCYKTEFKHIVRYARVLGMDTEVDPEQLRHGLRHLARKDPQKFNDGLKNKLTLRKFYVLEAMDKGLIKVDLKSNTISWGNGNLITHSPLGKNPVDHFVDMSISTTEFDMAFRAIQQELEPGLDKPKQEVETRSEIKTDDGHPVAPIDINSSVEQIIETCVQRGVIKKKASWFLYGDRKFLGNKNLIEEMNNDAVLKDALIKACS